MELKCFYLCHSCIKDKYLHHLFSQSQTSIETCAICVVKKSVVNVSDNENFRNFSRFLIRYHYPEYDYNPHVGGDDLPRPFYNENPILSHNFIGFETSDRKEEIDDFLHELFDLHNYKNPIELYCGHYEGTRLLFTTPIKEEKSKLWESYKSHLKDKNYFLIEDDAKKNIGEILGEFKTVVLAKQLYWRSRIGFTEIAKFITITAVKLKTAYTHSDIGAPPAMKATPGRANRQGVSFLYLASDKHTALGEVRPHPGHYVSIGKFESLKDLTMADLRFVDLSKFYNDPKKLETFKLLRDLGDELGLAVLPEEKQNYLITQFISDIIRQLGFDGILFNSSVSNGHNLVIFDPNDFRYLDNDGELVRIVTVDYRYKTTEYHIDGFLEKAIEK